MAKVYNCDSCGREIDGGAFIPPAVFSTSQTVIRGVVPRLSWRESGERPEVVLYVRTEAPHADGPEYVDLCPSCIHGAIAGAYFAGINAHARAAHLDGDHETGDALTAAPAPFQCPTCGGGDFWICRYEDGSADPDCPKCNPPEPGEPVFTPEQVGGLTFEQVADVMIAPGAMLAELRRGETFRDQSPMRARQMTAADVEETIRQMKRSPTYIEDAIAPAVEFARRDPYGYVKHLSLRDHAIADAIERFRLLGGADAYSEADLRLALQPVIDAWPLPAEPAGLAERAEEGQA